MSIFESIKIYPGKWNVKEERAFTAEELNVINQAVVVASQYGNSVQFTMKEGGMTFIPLDLNSNLGVGEVVDLQKAKLLTLSKDGEKDIYRVSI